MANKIETCLQICADWGLVPTEFRQCMTWEEQVLWLGRFLQTVIIPTTNQIITDFDELVEYVTHYLDSQDFEQMVSDKLDEMAADGTLGELIGQYISDEYVKNTDYATAETGGVVKVGDTLEINDGVLNEKEFADYISGVDFKYKRYQGTGGYTNVWYAIVEAGKKPNLELANDTIDTVEYPWDTAYRNKTTLTVNAGVWDTTNDRTRGTVVVDGEYIRGIETVYPNYVHLLYMTADGLLHLAPSDIAEETLMAQSPVWAVQGFCGLVDNYITTDHALNNTDYREHTIIGQDGDGNYLVFTTGGRGNFDIGLNPYDCVQFCSSINFVPRILYMLDAGGSAQIVYHGVTMNILAQDTGDTRKVANVLSWKSPNPKNQAVFDATKTINDAIITNRRAELPLTLWNTLTAGASKVSIGGVQYVADGSGGTINISGYFTISSSALAAGANIATGLVKPQGADQYFAIFNKSTKATYLCYVDIETGNLVNGDNDLPVGTYLLNYTYRIKPFRTISAGLE